MLCVVNNKGIYYLTGLWCYKTEAYLASFALHDSKLMHLDLLSTHFSSNLTLTHILSMISSKAYKITKKKKKKCKTIERSWNKWDWIAHFCVITQTCIGLFRCWFYKMNYLRANTRTVCKWKFVSEFDSFMTLLWGFPNKK